MPAYEISDFKNGMDLRKLYATAPAGSLRVLRNAVITAGAEIEKRASLVPWQMAPAGSLGLLSRNGLTYVVVNGTAGITVPPDNTTLGQIKIPFGAHAFDYVADWDLFNGNFYLVMHDPAGAGSYVHYYNQALVTDVNAKSHYIRTYRSKMYGLDGRLLRFSAIGDPTNWTAPTTGPGNGAGFIDLSAQDADSTNLIGMEAYYDQVAIFSLLSTQFWTLDPDPAQNRFNQVLRQTGLIASSALSQFGSGDVMYLSPYGLRSLRVQNISLTAGTTDLGSPIDKPLRQLIWDHQASDFIWFRTARALIVPRTGRMWLALPDRSYILSTYQEPAITAWSQFDWINQAGNPFTMSDIVVSDPYVMVRDTTGQIYQYGGGGGGIYDNVLTEVITPALQIDTPSDMKMLQGFDVACRGTWSVYASYDPNQPNAEELVATVTDNTFRIGEMTMPGWATHVSLRFRSTDSTLDANGTPPTLGKALVHFEKGRDD